MSTLKQYNPNLNVLEAARQRVAYAFDNFEKISVSFSGGKDSSVMLHLVMAEAIKRGRKVGVLFIDMEAQYLATIDHIREMTILYADHIDLHWTCVPMALRNAVTNYEPKWTAWDPEKEDIWIRELPPEATTSYPWHVPGMEFEEFVPLWSDWYSNGEKMASFVGIRADESLNRFRTIASAHKEMHDNHRFTTRVTDTVYNCQPAGTLVSVVDAPRRGVWGNLIHQVPIEELKAGDQVVSYHRPKGLLRRDGQRITAISSRPYDGDLVTVETANLRTQYTPEHICIVKNFAESFSGYHVYLMRKGASFRVGRCQGWGVVGSGIRGRRHTEDADAIWILGQYATVQEAALAEYLVQWRYGIPGMVFGAPRTVRVMTQDMLDRYWSTVGDLTDVAKRCLEEHGRSIDYPMLPGATQISRHRGGEVRACNLMDGMELVTSEGEATPPIKVSRQHYKGDVWFMDVENDHTYVADGIITHNCYPIYDWKTEDIWRFHARYPELPHNPVYDLMHKAGVPLSLQRLCQPYGDDQRRGLWLYHILEPQTWFKLITRVNGANAGALYVRENGNVMGYGRITKPDGHTWHSFVNLLLLSLPKSTREHYISRFRVFIKGWKGRGYTEIPDEAPKVLEDAHWAPSWRRMAKVLLRGDYYCKGLGFTQPRSSAYGVYLEMKSAKAKVADDPAAE